MLLLLQETLEYIEDNYYKFMEDLNDVTIAEKKKYERLHYKITSEILNQIRTLYRGQIPQNAKTESNQPTNYQVQENGEMVTSACWSENLSKEKDENKDTTTLICGASTCHTDLPSKCDDYDIQSNNSLDQTSCNYEIFNTVCEEDVEVEMTLTSTNKTKNKRDATLKSAELRNDNYGKDFSPKCDFEEHDNNIERQISNFDPSSDSTPPEHNYETKFKCEICENTFSLESKLKLHMLIHTGETPFHCEICGEMFSSSSLLQQHMAVHIRIKSFKCEICKKEFSRNSTLKKHKFVIHTREKPFKCNICQRKFLEKCKLNKHKLTHTGQTPFGCQICGKHFLSNYELHMHIITHTGEKAFECDLCRKRFAHRSNLRQHMLVHSGLKPFRCDVCEKKFSQKSNLKRHLLTHTN